MATRTPARKTAIRKTAAPKKIVPKAAVPAQKPAPAPAPVKPAKVRAKLVRDGFTMPEADFALIAALKTRAVQAGREAKKSELLRAGLQALAALEPPALVQALGRLMPVKTGRPKKGH